MTFTAFANRSFLVAVMGSLLKRAVVLIITSREHCSISSKEKRWRERLYHWWHTDCISFSGTARLPTGLQDCPATDCWRGTCRRGVAPMFVEHFNPKQQPPAWRVPALPEPPRASLPMHPRVQKLLLVISNLGILVFGVLSFPSGMNLDT